MIKKVHDTHKRRICLEYACVDSERRQQPTVRVVVSEEARDKGDASARRRRSLVVCDSRSVRSSAVVRRAFSFIVLLDFRRAAEEEETCIVKRGIRSSKCSIISSLW